LGQNAPRQVIGPTSQVNGVLSAWLHSIRGQGSSIWWGPNCLFFCESDQAQFHFSCWLAFLSLSWSNCDRGTQKRSHYHQFDLFSLPLLPWREVPWNWTELIRTSFGCCILSSVQSQSGTWDTSPSCSSGDSW